MGELNEVVLIAEAAALPGKRDELRRAFDELVPRALAEAGVRTFRLHEDRDQSGHFMLYERYRDQDASGCPLRNWALRRDSDRPRRVRRGR